MKKPCWALIDAQHGFFAMGGSVFESNQYVLPLDRLVWTGLGASWHPSLATSRKVISKEPDHAFRICHHVGQIQLQPIPAPSAGATLKVLAPDSRILRASGQVLPAPAMRFGL
jgi:hypothetical protein